MAVAVVFPGQGSQFPGMGKDFYDAFPDSREFFERADNALGYDLSRIILEGPEEELKLTENTQPALLTVCAAIWARLSEKVKADVFAGHSLGEYTALYAAGGITFEDAVKAVHMRGKFMQEAVPVGVGAMAAVLGLSDDDVRKACAEISTENALIEPANFNCPGQVVVAGHAAAFDSLAEAAKAKGAKRVISLPVSAPFHCSLMKPAADKMAEYLGAAEIRDLSVPVFNNVDAAEERSSREIKDSLIRQVSGAVRWSDGVRNMISFGVTTFIEVGPGSVLTGLIKKIDRGAECVNVSGVDDLGKL